MKRLLFLLSLFACWSVATVVAQPSGDSLIVDLGKAEGPVISQPNGPFAAFIFEEDALGTHIGLVYLEPMGVPKDGAWSLDDRFWQEEAWSADARNVAWSPNGQRLYVATSQVYGSGGLFELDLIQRQARQLFPSETAPAPEFSHYRNVHITAIDADSVEVIVWDRMDEVNQEAYTFSIRH